MIAVAAAVLAAVAVGMAAERRSGAGAQRAARAVMSGMLWFLLPFVGFFNIARLEITADVGGGIALSYGSLALCGGLAWWLARGPLKLDRPGTGALICTAIQANTGFLGLPLTVALLGSDELSTAVAYDSLVQAPTLFIAGFAVGAAFGSRAGRTGRERVRSFLRNPPLYAVVLGLLAPEALAPDVLVDASRVVVLSLLPLGFFVVGVTLAAESRELGTGLLIRPTAPVGTALVLRLALAPALLLALSAPLIDLPDAYLLLSAAPVGINTLLIGHAFGLDQRLLASSIAWSTLTTLCVGLIAVAIT